MTTNRHWLFRQIQQQGIKLVPATSADSGPGAICAFFQRQPERCAACPIAHPCIVAAAARREWEERRVVVARPSAAGGERHVAYYDAQAAGRHILTPYPRPPVVTDDMRLAAARWLAEAAGAPEPEPETAGAP